MSDRPLPINPGIGNAVVEGIQEAMGKPIFLVMIVCEHLPSGKVGQPAFITNFGSTADMENLITQIAGGFALAGKPTTLDS